MDLLECRKELDGIDRQIVELFEKEWKSADMWQNLSWHQEKPCMTVSGKGRSWRP